jgi:hypothetical protein
MSPVAANKNICTQFSTVPFSVWEISCWKLSPSSSETVANFSRKNPYGNAEKWGLLTPKYDIMS